ncbi:MAG: hypothetical protein JO123_09180 [Ktedonobacteraceae bacterium]|nr:hypothetical protein [Ktedonobacteraceae bacterium]
MVSEVGGGVGTCGEGDSGLPMTAAMINPNAPIIATTIGITTPFFMGVTPLEVTGIIDVY